MKQFFFFGDSITLGVNDPKGNGWVGRFIHRAIDEYTLPVPPTTFYNLGARRNSSRDILGRWAAEFSARRMQAARHYLVFCFGTVDTVLADGRPNVGVGESEDNARLILSGAKEAGRVLLMSPPPVRDDSHCERIAALIRGYATLCHEAGIPFLDIFTPLRGARSFLNSLADGIHSDPEGNTQIAALLLGSDVVRSWLQEG